MHRCSWGGRSVFLAGHGKVERVYRELAEAHIAGVPVLILAASYSGERAFEVYTSGDAAGRPA